ncbi:TonB-dependent receptor, partial [bacterium]|nr:TonB-dependent receptor [bacterium]
MVSVLFLCFILNLAIGKDQIGGLITGRVVDAKSNEPLPGVNLVLVGTFRGAATRDDGVYEIRNVPPGQYLIRAKMMGYEAVEQPVIALPAKTMEINFAVNPSVVEMGEVVVTATALPKLFKDVPVQTKVISRKQMEAQKVSNLAEALDFQTGVRVENNCQNCNFTQVRLLGLEGHYSQILIDSDPLVSSLAGVYGLEQFPSEMIERVEIVKGGGSALYGGTAVAGVVNLITKRPTHDDLSFDYRNSSIGGKFTHKLGFTYSRVSDSGKSSGYLFGTLSRREAYDHNGDSFSEIGKLNNEAVGLNWYYKPLSTGELSLHLHHIHEDRRGGNQFHLAPHLADIAEAIETRRYGGSLSWTHAPSLRF